MGLQEDGRLGLPAHSAWTFGALALLLAWDASGLDLALARLTASGHGFGLRDHWLVSGVLHQGIRDTAMAAALWLLLGIWWPTGALKRLSRPARVQWLASALLSVALVNVLKYASRTSCPWDLQEFDGVATYVSHWAWGQADGGPGRCFPAGHASAGFAFLGGFLALRPVSARLAYACLAVVLGAGLLAGIAQQLRGAHFTSHTLWTAWVCWTTALLVAAIARIRWPSASPIPAPHEAS